jgi:membrane fusion protein (multidrug efflux system)
MKHKARIVLGLVAIGGVVLGGQWWLARRGVESTDNAYIRADVTTISPKIAGYVTAVPVADNEVVAAGAVLVRVDDADHRARLAEAEAAVAAASAQLAVTDSRIEAQAAALQEAEAAIATWRAEGALADRELGRYRQLASNDFASRQRLDTAATAADKARSGLAQVLAQRSAVQSQTAVLEADRLRQEALLQQAEAARDLARDALDHTVIVAPRAGMIGNRGVRLGQYVTPGSHLMSLVPLDELWIDANFKETQIEGLRPGQQATIHVDAYPDLDLRGTVESLAPASGSVFTLLPPENAAGNFTKIVQRVPVRIALAKDANRDRRLRPGLSVVVEVDTAAAVPGDGEGTAAAKAGVP